MLYLVATPIGNLKDITYRAIEILQNCDLILCEDTRYTRHLLTHYGISKPLKSFHKFNEVRQEQAVLQELKAGRKIALVSDAGTPGIADPGAQLVQHCVEMEIPVQAIPGPCAAIAALTCSGLDSQRFQFVGFLPRKAGELRTAIQEILCYRGTTICYESPKRLYSVLEVLKELSPRREITVARELTKKFEELLRGNAIKLLAHWQEKEVKGEIVLLIKGIEAREEGDWSSLTPEEHVAHLEECYHLTRKEAIKMAAELRGVPKRKLYNALH
jgi:16S rRNA (cytidine1402-2'-O)-methyltransferase